MKLITIAKGLATYIPGIYPTFRKRKLVGGDSAEYYYGVWLKHLTMLYENGMRSVPDSIAGFGPGNSLGVGLAALLSGAHNYIAFDVVAYSDVHSNLRIFERLVQLFKQRSGRPIKGWPDFDPFLDANLFPSHILTNDVLETSLVPERIEAIGRAISNMGTRQNGICIEYVAPWDDVDVKLKESVDLIISHSVLQHVNDLQSTYEACSLLLRSKGFMSHQINFRSHGTAEEWNGHWAIHELLWKIIFGKRPYLINRQPCSSHISLVRSNGFHVLCDLTNIGADGIKRSQLAPRWRDLTDSDLSCQGLFLQAQKL